MKLFLTMIMLTTLALTATISQTPDWLSRRPRSDNYFYGRGKGRTQQVAQETALREIMYQLSSQVSAIAIMQVSNAIKSSVREKVDTFMNTARLRTAELEATHREGGWEWALVKYPEDCGLAMARSALLFYEEDFKIDPKEMLDDLDEGAMVKGARMERVIHDATEGNYGKDISTLYNNKVIRIEVMNYPAYVVDMTEAQKEGMAKLSQVLLKELEGTEYRPVRLIGHANPTGTPGEEGELQSLSVSRAQTMASFLRAANVRIGRVSGSGGREPIGDTALEEGRGMNRRVEIEVEIVQ